ncbi:hypothetical protein BDF19DRAFT_428366 [Syncephalis fuscata]|nr:hypothetical protein BDF19DRAFT_428366 [Syncephalis fuscata]
MSDILENTHALMDGCFNGRRKEKRQQQQQQLINDLEASLDELVVTGQELAGTDTIQVLDHPPTPLEFYRFVAANRPVLIKNVTHNWPAMHSWQKDSYLASILGKSTQITRQMSFGQFIQILRAELADQGLLDDVDLQKDQLGGDNDAAWNATRQTFPGVHYIQSQNGNLSGEFAPLANDIPIDIDFATTALGKLAANNTNCSLQLHNR